MYSVDVLGRASSYRNAFSTSKAIDYLVRYLLSAIRPFVPRHVLTIYILTLCYDILPLKLVRDLSLHFQLGSEQQPFASTVAE